MLIVKIYCEHITENREDLYQSTIESELHKVINIISFLWLMNMMFLIHLTLHLTFNKGNKSFHWTSLNELVKFSTVLVLSLQCAENDFKKALFISLDSNLKTALNSKFILPSFSNAKPSQFCTTIKLLLVALESFMTQIKTTTWIGSILQKSQKISVAMI